MEQQAIMSGLKKEEAINGIDLLHQIFDLQKNFANRFMDIDNLTEQEQQRWSKEMYICLTKEAAEALDWHNWKHWKSNQPMNIEEIKYELIDCLHFLVEWMLIFKMTPDECASLYITKNKENHNRQERKY